MTDDLKKYTKYMRTSAGVPDEFIPQYKWCEKTLKIGSWAVNLLNPDWTTNLCTGVVFHFDNEEDLVLFQLTWYAQ